mgnify:CR=1 FL=1
MATAEQIPRQRKREYHMRDIPTVPNAISATGLGLVAAGAKKFDTATKENDKAGQIIGALMILGGRTCDLADGLAARRLRQENDLGAGFDAFCDKFGMAVIGIIAGKLYVVPKSVLATIAAKNAVNAGATVYHGLTNDEAFRTPKSGKLSMAADNIAIAAYFLKSLAPEGSKLERCAGGAALGSVAAGAVLGVAAAKDYLTGHYAKAEDYSSTTPAANTSPRQHHTHMRRKRRVRG